MSVFELRVEVFTKEMAAMSPATSSVPAEADMAIVIGVDSSTQSTKVEARDIETKLASGLVLHPIYRRFYPEGGLASHIIGYSGSVGKLPTGPINFNEPLWEESEGRSGLEKIYNAQLTGDAGMKKLLFDENGNKLLEEQVKRPRPGGTLVTTIDLKWQQLAEKILRAGCKRGAFVVVDVVTGEVLMVDAGLHCGRLPPSSSNKASWDKK